MKGEGSLNGVPFNPADRVFVTGPHFGDGHGHGHAGAVFSSTENPAEASRYDRDKAEAILAAHRSWRSPKIEGIRPATDAEVAALDAQRSGSHDPAPQT
jgi:hypothetical protein